MAGSFPQRSSFAGEGNFFIENFEMKTKTKTKEENAKTKMKKKKKQQPRTTKTRTKTKRLGKKSRQINRLPDTWPFSANPNRRHNREFHRDVIRVFH